MTACLYPNTVVGYIPTKPKTNGDCVRAKTDEELAELLDTIQDEAMCYVMHDAESGYPIGKSNWLDWLKQEAVE